MSFDIDTVDELSNDDKLDDDRIINDKLDDKNLLDSSNDDLGLNNVNFYLFK